MTDPILLALLLAASFLLVAGWLCRLRDRVALGCCVHALVLACLLASDVEAHGKPRPLWLEWPACKAGTAHVLHALPLEPAEIRLWVDTPACGQRWWTMPWTREAAQQLQDARRGAKGQGGKPGPVAMRPRTMPGTDPQAPMFWPEPQPADPPKEEEDG